MSATVTIVDVASLTLADILARVDVAAAAALYAPSGAASAGPRDRPWEDVNPPPGTWRLNPLMGEFSVLVLVSPFDVHPNEPEDDIRRRCRHYPDYVRWYREGRVPPAIRTLRHALRCHIVSLDRRRVLAARDAGVATIPAWHSEARADDLFCWEDKALGSAWRVAATSGNR